MPRTVDPVLAADALSRHRQPELSGTNLLLRPWVEDDAPAIRAAFDVPDIQRWHLRRMEDLTEAREWAAAWSRRWAAGSDASWAITLTGGPTHGPASRPPQDVAVGYVALRTIFLAEGSAEVSYWVMPQARGQGVAARAVGVLARWAFTDLGLHRLSLMHSVANPRSCAASLRAGFAAEGVLRAHLRHADGWHDMHLHGRLASD